MDYESADVALPCATQNELDTDDAKELVNNGCLCVCEGANMPTTLVGSKSSMTQEYCIRLGRHPTWAESLHRASKCPKTACVSPGPKEEVDSRLHEIMRNIHPACLETAEQYGVPGNYMDGANIAGFLKVADAMMDQGLV